MAKSREKQPEGIMSFRSTVWVTGLCITLLAGCNPNVPASGHVPAPDQKKAGDNNTPPFCSLESHQTVELQAGSTLQVWNIRAHRLKHLAARLLIISDGKVQPANEVEYKWDKWEKEQPATTGQVIYLLQDGQAFGAKNKRLPQIGVEVQNSPSHARASKQATIMLKDDLQPRVGMSSVTETAPLANKSRLFAQVYTVVGQHDNVSITSEFDSMIEASKNGRTVVAVTLEWQAQ
jgi:hypothetical protein